MGTVFLYVPHPDDETLSMGLAIVHYLAAGYDVHLVSMTRGEAGGPMGSFNGNNHCNWANHPWTHDPANEGYEPLTPETLGEARLLETRSALGAMATVAPNPGVAATGNVFHHEGGLPDGFGTTSSTPVADAQAVIQSYTDVYPGAFHRTMSPADHHPDHAACGQALRNLEQANPMLGGAMFFISRLYWTVTDGLYAADLRAAAGGSTNKPNGSIQWFPTTARKAEFDAVLRDRVVPVFAAWSPAAGSYAIGYHQVAQQFLNNFGPTVSIGNLWHA